MADHVIDTNVLIVASAAPRLGPAYLDVPASEDEIEAVCNWLIAFRDDSSRSMVLDDLFKIYDEYHNKLSDQYFGMKVIGQKMSDCLRTVSVTYDDAGYGIVPPALSAIDNSDKKFVAAALNDPEGIHIVNACDGDWQEQANLLQQLGIVVVELLV